MLCGRLDTLSVYDADYSMLKHVLRQLEKHHGRFVVLDIHSYNQRHGGPNALPCDPSFTGSAQAELLSSAPAPEFWALLRLASV
jgi:hypothetical protein